MIEDKSAGVLMQNKLIGHLEIELL